MNSFSKCTGALDEISQPIKFLDYSKDSRTYRSRDIRNATDLNNILEEPSTLSASYRVISICQSFSWGALEIKQNMLEALAERYRFNQIHELASVFCERDSEAGEGFCIPLTWLSNEFRLEASYTIRYPEWKTSTRKWTVRQTGVCHLYDRLSQSSVVFLLHPNPDSVFYQNVQNCFESSLTEFRTESDHFWIHKLLFETHLPSWKPYITHLEETLVSISRKTVTGYVIEELRVGVDSLVALVGLQDRVFQAPTLISQMTETLDALSERLGTDASPLAYLPSTDEYDDKTPPRTPTTPSMPAKKGSVRGDNTMSTSQSLRNYALLSRAFGHSAWQLQQRAQAASQLLSAKLALQDQAQARKQNEYMVTLNRSVVFITTVTLFYLPGSFLAGVFGMDFFMVDKDGAGGLSIASSLWVYVLATVVLTAMTVGLFYWYGRGGGLGEQGGRAAIGFPLWSLFKTKGKEGGLGKADWLPWRSEKTNNKVPDVCPV